MKIKLSILSAVLATGVVVGIQNVRADDEHKNHNHASDAKTEQKDGKAKPYPLEKCIVSDEKLGEMGKPISKVYNGQEIKFCCKDCVPKFEKDQAKYMKKLADEQKKSAEKK